MKKIYLLLSGIILISSSAWSQCTISGSVSPTCENGAIQTLTTTGNFLLGSGLSGNTFNPSLAGTGTHIIDAYDISNGYTYTVNTTGTFAPVPSAGTPVTLSDDAITGLLPIGFNFTFFGNTYSNFVISSNGFISFDAGVSQGCCSGGVFPTNDAVNNVIAYHWNDLYPPGGGSITYETVGIAPNRRLLVTFTNQSHCCNTTGGNTAQIILYETSNIIEMHTTSATNDGSLATQGIENANGTVGYTTPGRNSTVWTTTNDYVAFIPNMVYAVNTTGTFAPVPSAGTPVTLSDDAITGLLPIGFNFTFFGNTYSNFVISSNGFISFDAGVSQGCCSGGVFPTNDAVNNVIAYHWNDLYPPGGGSITYETVGIAPNRRLLVTFTNQSHCCNTTGGNTAQIILYETLNVIEMHTTSATNDGSLATQGIENANGTVGYTTPGRNSTVWTTTNDYVAFIPGAICATTSIVVNGSSVGTDVVSACGSFTWIDNVTYTTSNSSATHTLTGGNSVGCDSIVTLNLTINNSSAGTDVVSACGSYTWIDNVTYTTSNSSTTYTLTGGNSVGCDSIVTLNLTINNSSAGTDVVSACGSYTWIDNVTYTTSNSSATYTLTGGNSVGCDSIVTLNLTINNSSAGTDVVSACGSYTWIDNVTYTTSNSSATYTLTGGNSVGCDSIVTLNLTINNSSAGTDVVSACGSYTWIDNVTYTTSNSSATYTLTGGNSVGCDSIVTLNLTINTIDNTVTNSSPTLTSNQLGATYQWLDCDNNFSIISGETAQSYLVTTTGNYAVEITLGGCVDTSACENVIINSIKEITNIGISVYPNPTSGLFTISLDGTQNEALNYSILNLEGKTVKQANNVTNKKIIIDISSESKGVYFLKIYKENTTNVYKIIKQ